MDAELAAAGRERVLLERNRDVARAQVAAATRTRAELASLHAAAAELRLGLDAATPEERGALVRQLVPGRDGLWVTVGPEQVEIIGHFDAGPARDSLSKWDAAGSEPEPSAETAPALTFRLVAR
jgi:hypothetical protein